MDSTVTRLFARLASAARRLVLGPTAAFPAVIASGPRVLPAYAALARYRPIATALEPRLRMLVMQLAADRSRCRWCIDKGRHEWREAQLPLEMLRALPHYATSGLFSTRERAALRFTDALTRYSEAAGRSGIPVEPLALVREHLSEPEVAALTAAVAEQHFFNPITGEFGADAEPRVPARSVWGAPVGTALRSFWL